MQKVKKQKRIWAKKGFTLAELMVVIAIVGILSTVAFGSMKAYGLKKKNNQAIADLVKIKSALDTYYAKNSKYPISKNIGSTTRFIGLCLNVPGMSGVLFPARDKWISELVPAFIDKTPVEPNTALPSVTSCTSSGVSSSRQYIYKSDGYNYKLVYLNPENMSVPKNLIDPVRTTTAYGFWTEGAKNW